MSKEFETMTVGQLRAFLKDFPDKTPVGFSYPSGDHCRTVLAGEINGGDWRPVKYTAYHQCFRLADEDDEDSDKITQVLLLES